MTTPVLFWNDDQDDKDLLPKYENSVLGFTWYFTPFKHIDDDAQIETLAAHYNQRGIGHAVAELTVRSHSWEGGPTILPATYKTKVRKADHSIVTDKAGKPKLKLHQYAGKQSRPTADLVQDMPDDVLAGAYRELKEWDGARTVAGTETFRGTDSPGDASETEDAGRSAGDRQD